jgi:tetratricopeptide (TPR) repeat protein
LEKKPGTGQLTKTGQNHLLELNFARESLNRLDRPIVFWINPENQALLANQAADLFGQRRLSTFYFSYHPEVFDDNPFFQDRFQDGSHDPAEYERLKLRTNLLEKQLEEAESKKYPPAKIARDIALPLAISYSKLGDIYQAQGKFKEALDYFKKDLQLTEELFQANPHNVDLENGLAISYYKLAEIYRAIPNSETDPAPYYRRAVEIWERILQRTGWPKLEGYIEHVKKRLEEG